MQRIGLFAALIVIVTACTTPGGSSRVTPGPASALPYRTATLPPTLTPIPPQTEVVLPTATPMIYVIVQGDTLSGIALRFNVSLEALMAANPGIQPTALSVGTKIIIPVGGTLPGEPSPTPAPIPVQQAHCWPGAEGGLWCFALVHNDYPEALENLSIQLTLLDSTGREIASQVVSAPLNILPAGGSMPLAAHFPAPVDIRAVPRAQVLSAIRLLPADPRYLPVVVQNTLVSVDWSGRSAQVSGQVRCMAPSGSAKTLWVLAVAYDAAGEVVGVRRWEAPLPLAAGDSLGFDFSISSTGPEIDRVEFLAEARP